MLDDPAPFVPLVMKKRGKETDYEAKTVMLAGRRYIVCRNHQEAAKDAADRASIVAALDRQLAKGDKERLLIPDGFDLSRRRSGTAAWIVTVRTSFHQPAFRSCAASRRNANSEIPTYNKRPVASKCR